MKPVNAPREVLTWLEQRAGCHLTSDARGLAAVDDRGVIRGMIAYDDVTPGSCECHIAMETPLALRALIPACFVYPFRALGLQVVVGVTPANNPRALALNKRLGFVEVYRVRDAWALGVDMVVQELRAEGCARFMPPLSKEAA